MFRTVVLTVLAGMPAIALGQSPVYVEWDAQVPCLTKPLAEDVVKIKASKAAAELAKKLDEALPFWEFKPGPAPQGKTVLLVTVQTALGTERLLEITAVVRLSGANRPLIERPLFPEAEHLRMARDMGVELRWTMCSTKVAQLLLAEGRDVFRDGLKRKVPVADGLLNCQERSAVLPLAFQRLSDFSNSRFKVYATRGKQEESFMTTAVGRAAGQDLIQVRHSKVTMPAALLFTKVLVEAFEDTSPPPGLDEPPIP
jgi:hypothetical protein